MNAPQEIIASFINPKYASDEERFDEKGYNFMLAAHACTGTEDAMRSYLERLDWNEHTASIMRAEPVLHINLQRPGDASPKKASVNPLTPFKYMQLRIAKGGNATLDGSAARSRIRISFRREGTLLTSTRFPYAGDSTPHELRIANGDCMIVEEDVVPPLPPPGGLDSESVDPTILPRNNLCFDPALKGFGWFDRTLNRLASETRHVPENDLPALLRRVASFWLEPDTGRLEFLHPDMQMVSTFPHHGKDVFVAYGPQLYNVAKRDVGPPGSIIASYSVVMTFVLSCGLMEQAQFSKVDELLRFYSERTIDEAVDEGCMVRSDHKWLRGAYAACESRDTLGDYVRSLDAEARKDEVVKESLSVTVNFFHVRSRSRHNLEVNPEITLETLIGMHAYVGKLSYGSLEITADDGRDIPYGASRKMTIRQLGLPNLCVLNVNDRELPENFKSPPQTKEATDDDIVKSVKGELVSIVHAGLARASSFAPTRNFGRSGCMLCAVVSVLLNSDCWMVFGNVDKIDGNMHLILKVLHSEVVRPTSTLKDEDHAIDVIADVSAKDKVGSTPLNVASYNGHVDIVKILIDNGADVNPKRNDGFTPLHYATVKGHVDVARVLIDNGANVNAMNSSGWTPLGIAKFRNEDSIVELLENAGAQDVKAECSRRVITVLFAAIVEQCLVTGAQETLAYFVSENFMRSPAPLEEKLKVRALLTHLSTPSVLRPPHTINFRNLFQSSTTLLRESEEASQITKQS